MASRVSGYDMPSWILTVVTPPSQERQHVFGFGKYQLVMNQDVR